MLMSPALPLMTGTPPSAPTASGPNGASRPASPPRVVKAAVAQLLKPSSHPARRRPRAPRAPPLLPARRTRRGCRRSRWFRGARCFTWRGDGRGRAAGVGHALVSTTRRSPSRATLAGSAGDAAVGLLRYDVLLALHALQSRYRWGVRARSRSTMRSSATLAHRTKTRGDDIKVSAAMSSPYLAGRMPRTIRSSQRAATRADRGRRDCVMSAGHTSPVCQRANRCTFTRGGCHGHALSAAAASRPAASSTAIVRSAPTPAAAASSAAPAAATALRRWPDCACDAAGDACRRSVAGELPMPSSDAARLWPVLPRASRGCTAARAARSLLRPRVRRWRLRGGGRRGARESRDGDDAPRDGRRARGCANSSSSATRRAEGRGGADECGRLSRSRRGARGAARLVDAAGRTAPRRRRRRRRRRARAAPSHSLASLQAKAASSSAFSPSARVRRATQTAPRVPVPVRARGRTKGDRARAAATPATAAGAAQIGAAGETFGAEDGGALEMGLEAWDESDVRA